MQQAHRAAGSAGRAARRGARVQAGRPGRAAGGPAGCRLAAAVPGVACGLCGADLRRHSMSIHRAACGRVGPLLRGCGWTQYIYADSRLGMKWYMVLCCVVGGLRARLAATGGHGRPRHALVPVEADVGAAATLLRSRSASERRKRRNALQATGHVSAQQRGVTASASLLT